jgi:hypothetical protein
MELHPSLLLALAAGVAIAAASGLRAFLPLLGVGLAGRFLHLPLNEGTRWLTSDVALFALAVAAVIEIAGDKIPVVDHALDVIGTFIRPAAAAVAAYAMLDQMPARRWRWEAARCWCTRPRRRCGSAARRPRSARRIPCCRCSRTAR